MESILRYLSKFIIEKISWHQIIKIKGLTYSCLVSCQVISKAYFIYMKNSIEKQIIDLSSLADHELLQGNLEKSLSLLNKTEKLLKSLDDPDKRQNCCRFLYRVFGKYYSATEDYLKACVYYEDLLKFCCASLSKQETIEVLSNLCTLHQNSKNFTRLLERAHQGLYLILEYPDSSFAALFNYYAGIAYQNLKNYNEAEKSYKQSLAIANSSLGYSHPTTSMVMKNYLKLLKISQTPRTISRNFNERTQVNRSVDSKNQPRAGTGSKKNFLPKIRKSAKADTGLIPIIPNTALPVLISNGKGLTPRAGSVFEEGFKDLISPIKVKNPQSSCRIRARRLSADSNLGIMDESKVGDSVKKPAKRMEKLQTSSVNPDQAKQNFISHSTSRPPQPSKSVPQSNPEPSPAFISKVTKIQKAIRGFLCRKRLKYLKRESIKAKTALAVHQLNDLKAQIIIMKTVEHEAKEYYKAEYTKKDVIDRVSKYILQIQRFIRCHQQRLKFRRVKLSTIKIQSVVKMYLVKVLYQKIIMAIRFIQSSWRGYKLKCKNN